MGASGPLRAAESAPAIVHVRWLMLRDAPRVTPQLLAELSDDERVRHSAMANEAHALRFVLGRLALRAVAAEVTGCVDVSVRARCGTCGGPHGRPVLGGSPELDRMHASIASGPTVIAVAVSASGPIGIDVEAAHAEDSALRGVARLLGTEPAIPESAADTVREWTRIEAVLKADGRGLAVDPASVRFSTTDERLEATISDEPARFAVLDVVADPGVVMSVATARTGSGPARRARVDGRRLDPLALSPR